MIPVVVLIVGLVLIFVTNLVTLGVVLTIVGGVWLLVQLIMFIAVVATALALQRKVRRRL